jgi:hypothetical protein
MTATMNTSTNGSPRKNLASQLDRLDGILDGLAEGLNDAVAGAVKDAVAVAVQEAVRGILAEVLANPDVLARLRGLLSQTAAVTSTPVVQTAPAAQKSWLGNVAAKVGSWGGLGWRSVRNACASLVGRVTSVLSTFKRRWQLVRQFRIPLLTAVVVGAGAGVGAYCGGPSVAALAGWIAGFTTTLTVQAGIWLRGALGSVPTDYA